MYNNNRWRCRSVDGRSNPGQPDADITMDILVSRTGLTPRQVRRCISENMIPPPTGKGPAARYTVDTLRKLEVVSRLMKQRVEPQNRPMRLKEIKAILAGLSGEQTDQIRAGLPFAAIDDRDEPDGRETLTICDTISGDVAASPIEPESDDEELDREYLDLHETDPRGEITPRAQGLLSRAADMCGYRPSSFLRRALEQEPTNELLALLGRLLDNLKDVTGCEVAPDSTKEDTWTRVISPVIEIHVKTPEDETERNQLITLCRSLERLIEQGAGP